MFSSSGSLVRPKVVRSVHYCPATKKTMERKYTDLTSLDAFPSSAIYPTKVTLLVLDRSRGFVVVPVCTHLRMTEILQWEENSLARLDYFMTHIDAMKS